MVSLPAGAAIASRVLLGIVAAVLAVLVVNVTVANAAVYQYFGNNACCTNREYSAYFAYMLSNASAVGDSQVVCVQEYVWPNYPSSSGSFYDGYKCGTGSTSHGLNGANADQALCWVNGSTTYMACDEGY
jgi:hypothetical protein